jgi:hypothetical protein
MLKCPLKRLRRCSDGRLAVHSEAAQSPYRSLTDTEALRCCSPWPFRVQSENFVLAKKLQLRRLTHLRLRNDTTQIQHIRKIEKHGQTCFFIRQPVSLAASRVTYTRFCSRVVRRITMSASAMASDNYCHGVSDMRPMTQTSNQRHDPVHVNPVLAHIRPLLEHANHATGFKQFCPWIRNTHPYRSRRSPC